VLEGMIIIVVLALERQQYKLVQQLIYLASEPQEEIKSNLSYKRKEKLRKKSYVPTS